MINRQNYQDVYSYLNYQEMVLQNEQKTVKRVRAMLRHLLEWADEKPFPRAREIMPAFPVYLLTARNAGEPGQLSAITMKKTCEYTRQFFEYCQREWPKRYKPVSSSWISTIRPPRSKGVQTELKVHSFYSVDDMLKIARTPVKTLKQERDRAAFCFLFLSGMRADAFISMPIKAVDLDSGRVMQLPSMGVRTKNHKAAVTTLLPIPEIMGIVKDWHSRVKKLPDNCLWFAPVSRDSDNLIQITESSEGRRIGLAKGLRAFCELAGIEYKSPHKLRHGHVVYALTRVKDMAGLKAVSQNVMHSSVGITDSLYGVLLEDDVHRVISGIHLEKAKEQPDLDNLAALLRRVIRENPEIITDSAENDSHAKP